MAETFKPQKKRVRADNVGELYCPGCIGQLFRPKDIAVHECGSCGCRWFILQTSSVEKK